MAKFALCVGTSTTPPLVYLVHKNKQRMFIDDAHIVTQVLCSMNLSMQDRATCETNPAYLQFIPYVVVQDHKGNIYSYVRGGSGGESRLHDQHSIGLGGHVDSMPSAAIDVNVPLHNEAVLSAHLKLEAVRELEEEVGLKVDVGRIEIMGLLVDATTPVQEVHLGVLCRLLLKEGEELGSAEEDVIVAGKFYAPKDLATNYLHMENWSKLAFMAVTDQSRT